MQQRSFSYWFGSQVGRLPPWARAALAVGLIVGAGVLLLYWVRPNPAGGPATLPAQTGASATTAAGNSLQPNATPVAPPPATQNAPVPAKAVDPNAIPETWRDFRASNRKDDQQAVAAIEKAKWWQNCANWGAEARKKKVSRRMWALQSYLQSSSLINGVDLGNVKGKVPEVGMTTCGALAVMGKPDDINRTKNASGERVQMVWRDPRVYAYSYTSTGDGNAVINSVQY